MTLSTPLGPMSGQSGGGREHVAGAACTLFVRPEQLALTGAGSGPNRFAAVCETQEFEGSIHTLHLRAAGLPLRLYRMNDGSAAAAPSANGALSVGFDPQAAIVLPQGAEGSAAA